MTGRATKVGRECRRDCFGADAICLLEHEPLDAFGRFALAGVRADVSVNRVDEPVHLADCESAESSHALEKMLVLSIGNGVGPGSLVDRLSEFANGRDHRSIVQGWGAGLNRSTVQHVHSAMTIAATLDGHVRPSSERVG
jgi:hypothetical protein